MQRHCSAPRGIYSIVEAHLIASQIQLGDNRPTEGLPIDREGFDVCRQLRFPNYRDCQHVGPNTLTALASDKPSTGQNHIAVN